MRPCKLAGCAWNHEYGPDSDRDVLNALQICLDCDRLDKEFRESEFVKSIGKAATDKAQADENWCFFIFKSEGCSYEGPETECDKTIADCRLRFNDVKRFGRFPSFPRIELNTEGTMEQEEKGERKTVLDFITKEQLLDLREAGFVIVHQVPTPAMLSASMRRGEFPEDVGCTDIWHRMVGESIRSQNAEIERRAQEKEVQP
jgi:hypothetical protein